MIRQKRQPLVPLTCSLMLGDGVQDGSVSVMRKRLRQSYQQQAFELKTRDLRLRRGNMSYSARPLVPLLVLGGGGIF